MKRRPLLLAGLLLAVASLGARAQGTLVRIPTREGVLTTVFWQASP